LGKYRGGNENTDQTDQTEDAENQSVSHYRLSDLWGGSWILWVFDANR
jgi:hypothetical protein